MRASQMSGVLQMLSLSSLSASRAIGSTYCCALVQYSSICTKSQAKSETMSLSRSFHSHAFTSTYNFNTFSSERSNPTTSLTHPHSSSVLNPSRSFSSTTRTTLNTLRDNPGARTKRTRVGRGPGSKMGKTSRRGHKGTGQRTHGTLNAWFTGGSTPLYRRIPKRGFRNYNRRPLAVVNLDHILMHIHRYRIDPAQKITIKTLIESGLIKKNQIEFGVKILGGEVEFSIEGDEVYLPRFMRWLPTDLFKNMTIEATDFSTSASEILTKLNGRYILFYRNMLSLRAHIDPTRFEHPKRDSIPPPKLILKYRNQLVAGQYQRPKMGEQVHRILK